MSNYQVERWRNSDYPSHWDHEESFDTIEEAKEYILSQRPHNGYRIIEELWQDE